VLQQDLVPTILDIMDPGNTRERPDMDGSSLVPLLEERDIGAHSAFFLSECTWMRKQGWRTSRYKLIQALEPDLYGFPTWELYDLAEDPGELDNIADDRPDLVDSLRNDMECWKARRMSESGKPDPLAHARPSFEASGYRMRSL
jgi:arylsulfatase A-like enzyme